MMRTDRLMSVALLALAMLLTPAWLTPLLADEPEPQTTPAQDNDEQAEDAAEPEKPKPLYGRLAAAQTLPLHYVAEAYNGPLRVKAVHQRRGMADAQQAVLELEAAQIDRQLRAAREALERTGLQLNWVEREYVILQASEANTLQKHEIALTHARQDLEHWENVAGPDMLKSTAMELQQRIDQLADQRLELAQLEELYRDARLASRTQDIVLERTQRRVDNLEEALTIARNNHDQAVNITHPRRQLHHEQRVADAKMQLDHARTQSNITLQRKQLEVENARRAVRDAQEHLYRLERDEQALTIRTPRTGIINGLSVQPGDAVQNGQRLGNLHQPEAFMLQLDVPAGEISRFTLGQPVRLVATNELSEHDMQGKVSEIDPIGKPSGDGTNFTIIITIDKAHPDAAIGLRYEVVVN